MTTAWLQTQTCSSRMRVHAGSAFTGMASVRPAQQATIGAVLDLSTEPGLPYTSPGGWAAATLQDCTISNTTLATAGAQRTECGDGGLLTAPIYARNGAYLWLDGVEIVDPEGDAQACPPIVANRQAAPRLQVATNTAEAKALPVVYARPTAQLLRLQDEEQESVGAAPAGPPPPERRARMLAGDDAELRELMRVRCRTLASVLAPRDRAQHDSCCTSLQHAANLLLGSLA